MSALQQAFSGLSKVLKDDAKAADLLTRSLAAGGVVLKEDSYVGQGHFFEQKCADGTTVLLMNPQDYATLKRELEAVCPHRIKRADCQDLQCCVDDVHLF